MSLRYVRSGGVIGQKTNVQDNLFNFFFFFKTNTLTRNSKYNFKIKTGNFLYKTDRCQKTNNESDYIYATEDIQQNSMEFRDF